MPWYSLEFSYLLHGNGKGFFWMIWKDNPHACRLSLKISIYYLWNSSFATMLSPEAENMTKKPPRKEAIIIVRKLRSSLFLDAAASSSSLFLDAAASFLIIHLISSTSDRIAKEETIAIAALFSTPAASRVAWQAAVQGGGFNMIFRDGLWHIGGIRVLKRSMTKYIPEKALVWNLPCPHWSWFCWCISPSRFNHHALQNTGFPEIHPWGYLSFY